MTGLRTNGIYQFKVVAMNFNGLSLLESDPFNFNACLRPGSFNPPFKIGSTSTTITIGWEKPVDDGGCPLIGFAVYRDDGSGGEIITEINISNDLAVRNMPTLRKLMANNFPIGNGGKPFRFKVTAYNREGLTDSGIATYLLAGVPNAPTLSP